LRSRGGGDNQFVRAVERSMRFGLTALDGDGTLAVRLRLPPLTRRQAERLPRPLRPLHERWMAEQAPPSALAAIRRRGRQLALSLLELGEDRDSAERQLLRWRYHPSVAYESVEWAWLRHEAARVECERRLTVDTAGAR
ncbi:MAG TPA: hypothetical protein VFH45_12265, partial [Acidimicrobiales bacterium]|nr:hypothetical protein [Acidimicrobiales bacterium]